MRALSGIRVIDFGHYVAGPVAGMLLADQGAERNVNDVEVALSTNSCVARKLTWLDDLASDSELASRDVIVTRQHDKLGEMRTTGPAHWFQRSAISAGRPALIAGSDASSIFEELSRTDLDALVSLGVVKLP